MYVLFFSVSQYVFLKLVSDAPIYREEVQHVVDGIPAAELAEDHNTIVISLYDPQGFIGVGRKS